MNQIKWDWDANNADKKFLPEKIEQGDFFVISNIPPFTHMPCERSIKVTLERMRYYEKAYQEQQLDELEKTYKSMTHEELCHKLDVLIFDRRRKERQIRKDESRLHLLDTLSKYSNEEIEDMKKVYYDFLEQQKNPCNTH